MEQSNVEEPHGQEGNGAQKVQLPQRHQSSQVPKILPREHFGGSWIQSWLHPCLKEPLGLMEALYNLILQY